jgi:menaquinone-specific isochorismate synthase
MGSPALQPSASQAATPRSSSRPQMTRATHAVSLVARTVRVVDPGPLLALLPPIDGPSGVAWVRRGDGLVGWGVAAQWAGRGPERFAEAARWWRATARASVVREEVRAPGTGLVAFASFAFADGSPADSVLVVPRVVVGRRGGTAWVTVIGVGDELPAPQHPGPTDPPPPPVGTVFTDGARSGPDWAVAVAGLLEQIGPGELEKVVLARDLVADAAEPVDLRWPLARLVEGYPGCWTFHVDRLLGATPEMLVRLDQGLVTSRVLAGTIRRTGDDEHDLALAASLARSSKDLEEHEYAVRSVAEALAPHCASMNVPETPFVLHLPNVMHLATDVTGSVSDATDVLGLAASLHPSAAVCGTPTEAAAAAIAAVEGMDRARYAGPVGWTDVRGDGELGIALRCAELDPAIPSRLRLFAGCGVVAGSDPEDELAESAAKLVPMRDALSPPA